MPNPNKFYVIVYLGVDKKYHPLITGGVVRTYPNFSSATRAKGKFGGELFIAECVV